MKKLLISSLMLLSVFGLDAAPKRRAPVRRPAAAAVAPVAPAPVVQESKPAAPKSIFDEMLDAIKNLNLQGKSTVATQTTKLKEVADALVAALDRMTAQDIKLWDLNEKSKATGICKQSLESTHKLLRENNSYYGYTYWLPSMLQSNDSTQRQLIEIQKSINACYSKINQDGIVKRSLYCLGNNKMKTAGIIVAILAARKIGLFDMAKDATGLSMFGLYKGFSGLVFGDSLYAQGKIKFSVPEVETQEAQ